VVRRRLPVHLRAKFDSWDVAQSVWASVLEGFRSASWRFEDVAHLRALLVNLTRNRFIDLVREHRHALAAEQPLESADGLLLKARQPRPSEDVQAEELWSRMVALCPPEHRPILELKRQGKSLAEIAKHTGLHPSSIRRILYELARYVPEIRGQKSEVTGQKTSD
jgi:RNA polymerase sigma factor (sigma-70 family)